MVATLENRLAHAKRKADDAINEKNMLADKVRNPKQGQQVLLLQQFVIKLWFIQQGQGQRGQGQCQGHVLSPSFLSSSQERANDSRDGSNTGEPAGTCKEEGR